jgi:sporulation protein YlmC with PRC-barrel domain
MTRGREVRLERLIGKRVVDATGQSMGSVEDLEAEPDGDTYLVTHVLLGPDQWLARLRAFAHQLPTMRALGIGRKARVRRVPWTWLDLSDPEHPRLRETVEGNS